MPVHSIAEDRARSAHVVTIKKKKMWGKKKKSEVPPRLELGSLDSKSKVLTITPWNPHLRDDYTLTASCMSQVMLMSNVPDVIPGVHLSTAVYRK